MDLISHKLLKSMYVQRNKPMYDILNGMQVTNPTGKSKWADFFNITDSEWTFIYTLPFQICKDSKLQWTQVRINFSILTKNTSMYTINKTDNTLYISIVMFRISVV